MDLNIIAVFPSSVPFKKLYFEPLLSFHYFEFILDPFF